MPCTYIISIFTKKVKYTSPEIKASLFRIPPSFLPFNFFEFISDFFNLYIYGIEITEKLQTRSKRKFVYLCDNETTQR